MNTSIENSFIASLLFAVFLIGVSVFLMPTEQNPGLISPEINHCMQIWSKPC
jgi:hypothetical protein